MNFNIRANRILPVLIPLAIASVMGASWGLFAGKDLNWDQLNYHYYIAYALLSGRIDQDFFAASVQSYLNPVGYVPFYVGVSSGMHSVLISMALAGVQGLSIALLYFIARRCLGVNGSSEGIRLPALAAFVGCSTPVFWAILGTSFLDPLLVVPMLGGFLLLLGKRDQEIRWVQAFWAGVLFGIAAGLKYSNAFFAIAAVPLFFVTERSRWSAGIRPLAAYFAGGLVAVGLSAGPWMWRLYQKFGNPLFPFMNGWFKSPYFPPLNTTAGRFAPHGVADILALPFRMVLPVPWVYVEFTAPDVRFAAAIVVLLSVAALALRRKSSSVWTSSMQTSDRKLFAFFAASLALWLYSSANGRYGLLVLLLAGVCLARLVVLLVPLGTARNALLVIAAIQLSVSIVAAPVRGWITGPWSRDWYPLLVPEAGKSDRAVYFTVETLSLSALAPFLNPSASFVNLRGQYSIRPGSPAWQRVEALLTRQGGHARALGRAYATNSEGVPSPELVQAYDSTFARYGFRMDTHDCYLIRWRKDDSDALSRAANLVVGKTQAPPRQFAFSCALRRVPRDPLEIAEEKRISRVFDRIEHACPNIFHGENGLTERLGSDWSRTYVSVEGRLETRGERIIFAPVHSLQYIDLGTLDDWKRADTPQLASCRH
jgi:hypothetical protein